MALVLKDRVRETTTVLGTNDATLLGAVTGFQAFSVVGNGNTCYYTIADQSGGNWEVGIGTYSSVGPTLARTTILASSNSGSIVSFPAGTKDVFLTYPSEKAVFLDASGNLNIEDDGELRLHDTSGTEYVALKSPGTLSASYTLTLPADDGTNGQALITDGSGNLSWSTSASGDVYGPASATDNAVTRFDGTTGKLIQNSGVIIDDSNNVSGVAQLNATTVDLTNLEVTNIKAKDGTASITLADSTGVATFSANPIINSGTANGVAYLNGSKVLTTGSALTFDGTTLNFGGTAQRITGDFSNGTVPNRVGFQTSTVNGNTNIPFWPNGTATQTAIILNNAGSSVADRSTFIMLCNGATDASLRSGITGTGTYLPMTFYTGGSERMRIDTSGNVGIGTSSPGSRLTVAGVTSIYTSSNANTGSGYVFSITGTYNKTSSSDSTQFVLFSNDALASNPLSLVLSTVGNATVANGYAYLQASEYGTGNWRSLALQPFGGNVGIGTSSPGYKLDVAGSSQGIANFVSSDTKSIVYLKDSGTTAGNVGLFSESNALGFRSGGAERMRIDSSGNVGIGGLSYGARLEVNGYVPAINIGSSRTNSADKYATITCTQYSSSSYPEGFSLIGGYGQSASNTVIIGGGFSETNSANIIQFNTANTLTTRGGTERMRIDSSGNVGIGTSSPGDKFVVSNGGANGLEFNAVNGYIQAYNRSTAAYTNFTDYSLNRIFATGSSSAERMRIDSSGNVGIGTSSPGAKLDVKGLARSSIGTGTGAGGAGYAFYQFGTSATATENWHIGTEGDGSFRFYNQGYGAGLERMRIDSSGNVGIGTSSPGAKLDVVGAVKLGASNASYSVDHYTNVNWNYSNLNLWRNASNTATPRFLSFMLDGDSNTSTTIGDYNAIWGAYDSAPTTGSTSSALNGAMVYGAYAGHRWYTNGSERMRITSGGDLLLGTTSDTDQRMRITYNGTTPGWGIKLHNTATSGDNKFIEFGTEASFTPRGSISYNRGGGVVAYNTTSDYRLKENIVDLPNALQTISQLKPRQFDWKETGNTTTGFIAHELAEVLPHAVTGEKDAVNEDGSPQYQGIDTSFLVATLTAAIQELKAELDATKAEVAALKGN